MFIINHVYLKLMNIFYMLDRGIEDKISLFVRKFNLTFNVRRSSYPFVSGDTFRNVANYIFDSKKGVFLNNKIKVDNEAAIYFVEAHYINMFINNYRNKIGKYILITHNSDDNVDSYNKPLFDDDNLICWMAQNVMITDEKLIPIPIGLENRYLHRNGIVSRYQKKYKNLKVHRIFYCFDIQTNKYTRLPIHNYIKQHPLAETIEFGRVSNKFYLRKLSRYDFCLAPPGNGQDTHRMWECIYLGVIPIVFESAMNNHFKSIGLPILVIKSYEDLDGFKTEQDICEMKKTIISNSNTRAAYIDYYIQLIQNYKMLS